MYNVIKRILKVYLMENMMFLHY